MKNPTSLSLRHRKRAHLRAAILTAARKLFVRDGYEDFSMRALAQRMHCSPAALYLYFENRDELFDCLVEDSFARLAEVRARLQRGKPQNDPVAFLKKGARLYVEFGLKNPEVYKFAFLILRPDTPRARIPHQAYEALKESVAACVEQRRFRRVDIETASQALWTAIHGVTALLIMRPSFPWVNRDKLIQQVIDSAVDSLKASS
jgi:AcrR family transcriptional regulator